MKAGHGRTQGSVAYYAEADPRIKGIWEKWMKAEVTKEQVYEAVGKITGQARINSDWEKAKAPTSWIEGVMKFEEWFATQPEKYGRIYGSPRVIAKIIVDSREQEAA